MTKKAPAETTYFHPRYTQTPPKEWLKERDKHPTGFCNPYQPLSAQAHEGDKLDRRVCDFWDTCPCYCHYQIDEMFKMVGLDREPASQSEEYQSRIQRMHFETQLMLDSLPRFTTIGGVPSISGGTDAPPDHEGPYTGTGDGTTGTLPARPVFAPTPTGRRARGQLEFDVLDVCIAYTEGTYDWEACTPKLVSEEIGKKYAVEPPSTGAINAVWDRWEHMEFAEQAKKPSRFVRFTVEGTVNAATLDIIKARARREKKRGTAEQRRGSLRPRRGS